MTLTWGQSLPVRISSISLIFIWKFGFERMWYWKYEFLPFYTFRSRPSLTFLRNVKSNVSSGDILRKTEINEEFQESSEHGKGAKKLQIMIFPTFSKENINVGSAIFKYLGEIIFTRRIFSHLSILHIIITQKKITFVWILLGFSENEVIFWIKLILCSATVRVTTSLTWFLNSITCGLL